jgi:hypothetical protein
MLLFVGPQDVPRSMGHLTRGGHIGQEHETACLLSLASNDLSPLVHGDLQAIPQRFDHTWPRGTRPPRAILGALLDPYFHPMIGALQRPQLGGGGFGVRMTEILLAGCLVHGGLQRRVGRSDLTRQVLLAPLILAAGVHHHGPISLTV